MKRLASLTMAVSVLFSGYSMAGESNAPMDPYIRGILIDTCKAALTNRPYKLRKVMSENYLRPKAVAMKVMCNGKDISTFAYSHKAPRTGDFLSKYIGHVEIKDLAATHGKWKVTFDVAK